MKQYTRWQPYIEPVKPHWYETYPDRFVMCKVWDDGQSVFTYTPVKYNIDINGFKDLAGVLWQFAEPVDLDELTPYIL